MINARRIVQFARKAFITLLALCTLLNIIPFVRAQLRFEFDKRQVADRVVDAINAGYKDHVDTNGIRYRADPLENDQHSVASDYGRRFLVQRVPQQDQVLYQTERYSLGDFSYDLNVPPKDGDYVLVLKLSEVYFNSPGMKIFDVILNEEHKILSQVDVFHLAGGLGIARDELVPFTIRNNQLIVFGESSKYSASKLRVTFVKGEMDNPKINALVVMRGSVEDVPKLGAPVAGEEEDVFLDEEDHDDEQTRRLRREAQQRKMMQQANREDDAPSRPGLASGPAMDDPYASMDVSQMFMPILIALACFFPILYCLCRYQ